MRHLLENGRGMQASELEVFSVSGDPAFPVQPKLQQHFSITVMSLTAGMR
jgi:hypothetical protein